MGTIFTERQTGTTLIPSIQVPERQVSHESGSRLSISVVFTSVRDTLTALRTAGTLANKLHACITLIVPEVVSYQLPLNRPPVLHDWNEKRFRVLAAESSVETTVRFYFCRDRDETLARVLKPHSIVVIGGKKHWWPTQESRMANRLRKLGLEVVLAETE
jgi:hypothetical protein